MNRSLLNGLWLLFAIWACVQFNEVECSDCSSLGAGNFKCGKPNSSPFECSVAIVDFHLVKCLPTNCTALGGKCFCNDDQTKADHERCDISEDCECKVNCLELGGPEAHCACHYGSNTECPMKYGDCVLDCVQYGKVCQVLPGFELFSRDERCVLTQGGTCVFYEW